MTSYYQWSNQNEFRKYPLREEAKLVDNSGSTLPVRLIADLQCYVPCDPNLVFVRRATVTDEVVSVILSSQSSPVLAITRSRTAVQPWTAYDMVPLDGLSSGRIVFGELVNVDPVSCLFTGPDQSGIETRCLHGWHETVLSVGRRGRSIKLVGVVTFSPDVNVSMDVLTDGCYSIEAAGPYARISGMYVPSGTMNFRPVYVNVDRDDCRMWKGSDGKWKIGILSWPMFESAATYPDRPAWLETEPGNGGPYYPTVLRCNLVEVGLSKSTMEQFLGPCDRAGMSSTSKVLRALGGAPSNDDGTIVIKALKE